MPARFGPDVDPSQGGNLTDVDDLKPMTAGPRPRVIGIIQARMGSSRLPGKVLLPLGGRPVLAWVVRAAQESGALDEVVVATSVLPDDDAVAKLAGELGVSVVRGSEDDVLSRFLSVLDKFSPDAIVRITADCPLLDPALIRLAVATYLGAAGSLDYLSTVVEYSLPRGIDVEVVSAATLRQVATHAQGVDRTHVTSAVYGAPEQYKVGGLVFRPDAQDLRVTLDTADDLRLLEAVVNELGDRAPSWREVVALLRRLPELTDLNAHVRQKAIHEG
jgi:spore coat polysaccharide biosynthesis protein SpsF